MLKRLRSLVRQRRARRLNVPKRSFALERLAATGFRPKQSFDAGGHKGDFTRMCLDVWPGCRVACFEALENRADDLRVLAEAEPTEQIFRCLLGAETRADIPLRVSETGSSVLDESVPHSLSVQLCRMRTVDEVVAEDYPDSPPDFLKLDVQGYELEILEGAEATLPRLQVIPMGVNLLEIYRRVPLLAEIIGGLGARGRVAYDICELTRWPLDQALRQTDLIFVPLQSPLRADKHWGA